MNNWLPISDKNYAFKSPKKRTYKRGLAPCGNCNVGRHSGCRPRLDGAACSCNCPNAALVREKVALMNDIADATQEKNLIQISHDLGLTLEFTGVRKRGIKRHA